MKISAIIPTYNRAELISETLDSLLNQTRPPDEVIIVDDGSSDGTPDVVASYGQRISLICQENAGAGSARNTGFSNSTGDIIHFMDSDDLSTLNTYELQIQAIEAGADMVYGPWLKTKFNGRVLSPEPCALQQGPVPGNRPLDRLVLTSRWVTVFQPCIFRRSLIESAGPYRTDLKPSEDTEMLYRLTCRAGAIAHTPDTLVLYRVHPEGQVSIQNPTERRHDWANLCRIMTEHADARDDLDRWTRDQTRLRQVDIASKLGADEPDHPLAKPLNPRRFDFARLAWDKISRRIDAKARHLLTGDRSNRFFSPAPLTAVQRQEIAALGYQL